jgi:diguanylate cyclase (GGDEF)-like protein
LAIDQLKAYAGMYGKPVVEQVLKLAAPKVQSACQASRVFRVSGEELTFLFPRQSAVEALVELETIRKSIESTSLYVRDGQRVWDNTGDATSPGRNDLELPVTASIGVADSTAEGATLSVVIKAAYRALYEAKAGGGNAVKRGALPVGSFRRSSRPAVAVRSSTEY